MSTDKEYFHNKGAQDAAKEEYHKPHTESWNILTGAVTGPFYDKEQQKEENAAYDAGHSNTTEQNGSDSSICFLTTACVEYAGLLDDCHELQVLRHFRDGYVSQLPESKSILAEYYQRAPTIVRGIKASHECDDVLNALLRTIREIVSLIEAGYNNRAFDAYAAIFKKLNSQYGK